RRFLSLCFLSLCFLCFLLFNSVFSIYLQAEIIIRARKPYPAERQFLALPPCRLLRNSGFFLLTPDAWFLTPWQSDRRIELASLQGAGVPANRDRMGCLGQGVG